MTIKLHHLPPDTLRTITRLAQNARAYYDNRHPIPDDAKDGFVIVHGSDLANKPIPTRAETWGPA